MAGGTVRRATAVRGRTLRTVGHHARSWALAALLAAGTSSAALAAGSDTEQLTQLQQKLEQSIQMIDALAARVKELEARLGQSQTPAAVPSPTPSAAPAAAAAADQAQRIDTVEQEIAQIEAANATRHNDDTGLPIHGFADVGVGTDNPVLHGDKGFNVGNLDFYLTPRLGDRTLALFELNFEVGSDGEVGVDLERAQIGYEFSDAATLWLGRFHTPYGYVNTSLHHGSWVNDELRRPRFIDFEDQGGVLPAHTVGTWLTGAVREAGGKILYDAYVGNGQQIEQGVVDMQSAGNAHGHLIFGGRLGYEFMSGWADGLLLGVHAFTSEIGDDRTPMDLTRVNVRGAYVAYDTDNWENVAEVYFFDDRDLSGSTGTHHSDAGFVELAYRLSWGVPYVRYEHAVFDQTDQYFLRQLAGMSYHRSAVGVRFDLDSKSALKIELANTHDTDRIIDQYNEALVKYAIRF